MTPVEVEIRNSKFGIRNAVVEAPESAIGNRQSPITVPLLLEVGCEEIPARFLSDAEKGLGERVLAGLREARLLPEGAGTPAPSGRGATAPAGTGTPWRAPTDASTAAPEPPAAHEGAHDVGAAPEPPLRTFSTPRRLVVYAPALLAQQPDQVEEILGPPVKVAVDAEGKYTRAAESFVQRNQASLEDLTRTTTAKGEYLALRKTTQGRSARDILPEILPEIILGLTFPKSMYWTEMPPPLSTPLGWGVRLRRFVRPIRWVLAILGEGKRAQTLDFEVIGVRSGNFTFGHRTATRRALRVRGLKEYVKKLGQALVEINPRMRRERILTESKVLVETASLKLVEDEGLLDWIVNSTEWPRPMVGNFDERFLHLPREILITVMRDHQKYFAVEDGEGNLRPHFVAVLNMDSDAKGLIRQGHQRVLTARFRDAEFFWNADQRLPLRDRLPRLDKVTYQAKLGSYGDKVRRMKAIAGHVCGILESRGMLKAGQRDEVLQAVELSKCDLTTQMVQEFTELQGVVGGLYAQAQGEPEAVATAVYDHYLPLGAEGKSPRSIVGGLVSLVDKLDSVVGGFAVGQEPTGSSDPFALRRQANGIVKVLVDFSLPISPIRSAYEVAVDSLKLFGNVEMRDGAAELKGKLEGFFRERLAYYLESICGFRYDTVRAVVAAGADHPADAHARAQAMDSLRGGEDFEALSAAAKRIRNILTKSASAADWQAGEVDAALLGEADEQELYNAYRQVVGETRQGAGEGSAAARGPEEYRRALEAISMLRPTVDRFFDKVLVMAEDPGVRQNRLRLLKKLDELFSGVAHFAEIEGK